MGTDAGKFVTTAATSTFIGFRAGQGITGAKLTGNSNTAVGNQAGFLLQGAAGGNTLLGYLSGNVITTGTNNTVIGVGADTDDATATNQTVIGATTIGVADNSVTLGNDDVTRVNMSSDGAAVIYANGTINTSDRRFKENINDSDLGLEFINKVRPVKYNFKEDKHDGKTKYGIIAQEVLEVLKNSNNEDSSFIETDNSDKLGADYIQFIAPLIKSVQELTEMVKAQQKEIEELKSN